MLETEEERRHFKKLESRSTGRGLKYEHNMCSLVFARTTRLKYNFSLASNIEGCGALDDVVLQFSKSSDKKKSLFIQMKSKANTDLGFGTLLSPKSDFSLLKYFKSYLEIKKNFNNKSDTPFDGEFEDSLFVLYTNSDVTDELKYRLNDEKRKEDLVNDASDILLTNKENGGALLQLKLDGKVHDALVKALIENRHEEGDKNGRKEKKLKKKDTRKNKSTDEAVNVGSQSLQETEENSTKQIEYASISEKNDIERTELSNTAGDNSFDEQELRNQVKEFLTKLIIMYKQIEEECFDEVVKEELGHHLELTDEEMQLALSKFQHDFEHWWKEEDYFLDSWKENSRITKIYDFVKSEAVNQFLKHRKADIENLNINFLDSALKNVREVVENNQAVVMYSPKHTTQPTLAKINQLFPRIAILNLRDLVQKVECIMIAWKRSLFDILVVDVCEIRERLEDALLKIQQTVKDDKRRKVIFVSPYGRNMNYMKFIRNLFKFGKIIQDNLRYPELSDVTKTSVLQKKVLFQGQNLKLSALVSDSDISVLDYLDEESMSSLLSNEIPVIGCKLEDSFICYIKRKLEISRTLSENILQENDVIFAIDSETSEKLGVSANVRSNELTKFVLVENSADFQELCEVAMNVHWLKIEKRLLWKQSKGNLSVIRSNLVSHDVIEWEPKTVIDGDDRLILLTAEPGMGKSSLLTHLAKMAKERDPTMWVIRINIQNFTKILDEIQTEGFHEEKAVKILEVAAGIKDPKNKSLESALFQKAYVCEGNIVVLIDGLDEVSPKYTKEAIQIIRVFYDSEVSKIWVTARIYMKNTLEEEFGIPLYTLVPFDKQEQELFLVKFWMSVHPDKDEENLKSLARKLRRLIASQFRDHETDFMGIPIQSLLLAEISSSFDDLTVKNINLYTLYELYVEKKWEIYIREKMIADATNVAVSQDTTSIKRKFIDNHKVAAVIAFLKLDVLDEINSSTLINQANIFMRNVQNGIEKTGIIHSIDEAGRPIFLHRTFCEYFVALWVFENFMSTRPHNQEFLVQEMPVENIQPVLKRIFDDGFKVVKSILERMLAKGFDIHMAVLNDNDTDFNKALQNCDINGLDHGGRTPLHVASSCGNNKFVNILLHRGADECRLDALLRMSSVTYANRAEHWNIFTHILDKRPESRERELKEKILENIHYMIPILHCAKDNENSDLLKYLTQQNGWILLQTGVLSGHIDFIELVLSLGTAINASNPEGRTVLHITSENSEFSLARILILKGACVNSVDNFGTSPLHVAVERSSHTMIQLLLDNGAHVNSVNKDGSTALHVASKRGDIESMKILLHFGADVNATDNEGYMPLHLAAVYDGEVSQLLEHGAHVNVPSKDGSCPLHIASRYGHLNIVKILLQHKAPVAVLDGNGKHPLHLACENGFVEVARTLINNGAVVNVKDSRGCTPLVLADRSGHVRVKELLISNGATEEKEEEEKSVVEREAKRIEKQFRNERDRFVKKVKKLF